VPNARRGCAAFSANYAARLSAIRQDQEEEMALTESQDRPAAPAPTPLTRALFVVNGSGLLAAAGGLWLVPGSNLGADVLLMKLGLSLFLALGGLTFLSASRKPRGG
jgi:hypothetical protein